MQQFERTDTKGCSVNLPAKQISAGNQSKTNMHSVVCWPVTRCGSVTEFLCCVDSGAHQLSEIRL